MKSLFVTPSLVFLSLSIMGCATEGIEMPAPALDEIGVEDEIAPGDDGVESAGCNEVASLATEPFVGSCSYTNPFAQMDECRNYHGDWTKDEIGEECAKVFTGVSGTASLLPCHTENLVGVCGAEVDRSKHIMVHFYEGDPTQLASVCTEFMDGSFCGANGGTGPAEQMDPLEEAMESMISDESVIVSPECIDDTCLAKLVAQRKGISFTPAVGDPVAGLIFYPGAQVDPRAYAPIARRMAILGVKVIVVPMPGNLAITGIDRGNYVMTADIDHWFIGGHSMGGAMAVRFLNKVQSSAQISGVVLWAAYPDANDDISDVSIPVLSIAGSLDGVATPEEIKDRVEYLPADTEYEMLDGGNHAQFGTYGSQDGDLNATMSAKEQQQMVAALSVHFMKRGALGLRSDKEGFLDSHNPNDLCLTGQLMVFGVEAREWAGDVQVLEHDDYKLFAESKPSMEVQEDRAAIEVQAITRPFGNGIYPRRPAIMPGEVWCKMKTREAFEALTGDVVEGDYVDCAAINARAYDLAKTGLGAERQAKLVMGADNGYEMGVDWLKNGTVYVHQDALRSPTIVVGDDQSLPEAYRNVIYCKLWSPARIRFYLMTGL